MLVPARKIIPGMGGECIGVRMIAELLSEVKTAHFDFLSRVTEEDTGKSYVSPKAINRKLIA
jgi:hypothetical protein